MESDLQKEISPLVLYPSYKAGNSIRQRISLLKHVSAAPHPSQSLIIPVHFFVKSNIFVENICNVETVPQIS
jgi:hypothetical protein